MRDLVEVIDLAVAVIPAESEMTLIKQLRSVQDSTKYTPPEGMTERWKQASQVLMSRFCERDETGAYLEPEFEAGSWEEKLHNIWMNKE